MAFSKEISHNHSEAIYIGKTVTKDLKKSAAIGSFQKKNET